MCGIIGYVGRQEAAPILLDGLARMEYRGYDSAGVAVRSETKGLQVRKSKGRLQALSDMIHGGADVEGTLGIGHTRWATHGEPNDINAHPHVSEDGRIALVHNGIIENYMEIKQQLLRHGVTFQSETDTEVVAQLLEFHYNECHNMLEAVGRVLRRIEGSYAFGIICADYPNALIAARKDSPLIIGCGEGENFIASDVTAIISHTRDVIYMEDGEIAVLTAEGVSMFNAEMDPIEKAHSHIDWDVSAAEKGGYPHFMLKEIMEQPEAIRKTISSRIRDGRVVLDDLHLTREYIESVNRIFIVACGSSYHVGMVCKYSWERLMRRPVEVCLASEFRYSDPLVDEHLSGDLPEPVRRDPGHHGRPPGGQAPGRPDPGCGERGGLLHCPGGRRCALHLGGPGDRRGHHQGIFHPAGAVNLIALYLGDLLGTVEKSEYDQVLSEMERLPENVEKVLESIEDVKYFASRYFNHDSIFFIGRNLDYAMGMEGSLKLKEISYIHSEAYASGELKHGTISLIEPGTLVIALGTYAPLFDKAMSNVVEVKARGAEVLALTTEDFREKMEHTADSTVAVPKTHPVVQPSLGIVPLQLFAYYVALQRGCDIDKPRNLAKSVTVE